MEDLGEIFVGLFQSNQKRKLSERKEALASLSYHPIESFTPAGHSDRRSGKMKKQKL